MAEVAVVAKSWNWSENCCEKLELEKTLLELSSAQEMILSCFKKKET
jgi:hypothetical protein